MRAHELVARKYRTRSAGWNPSAVGFLTFENEVLVNRAVADFLARANASVEALSEKLRGLKARQLELTDAIEDQQVSAPSPAKHRGHQGHHSREHRVRARLPAQSATAGPGGLRSASTAGRRSYPSSAPLPPAGHRRRQRFASVPIGGLRRTQCTPPPRSARFRPHDADRASRWARSRAGRADWNAAIAWRSDPRVQPGRLAR